MNNSFFESNNDFVAFGSQHLIVLLLVLFLSIALPIFAKRKMNPREQLNLSRVLSILISFWVVFWTCVKLALGDFDLKTDLPLDICNMMALLVPFLMWRRRKGFHDFYYFWIMAGTLNALITPHLFDGFPNFSFFKYWFVHGGLVVYTIFITVVFEYRPGWKNLLKTFLGLQGYFVFLFIANLIFDSNYGYVMELPPTASLLDYMGEWPWYILSGEVVALFLFALLLLPFKVSFWKKAEVRAERQG